MKTLLPFITVVLLVACSRTTTVTTPPPPTILPAPFQAQWQQAQAIVATMPIDLNAALEAEQGKPPCSKAPCLPADPRARTIQPTGVTVTVQPDLTPAQLTAQGFPKAVTAPSGIIDAPSNASSKWAHSYTQGRHVTVVQSMVATAAEYEFENVILASPPLNYNTAGR